MMNVENSSAVNFNVDTSNVTTTLDDVGSSDAAILNVSCTNVAILNTGSRAEEAGNDDVAAPLLCEVPIFTTFSLSTN